MKWRNKAFDIVVRFKQDDEYITIGNVVDYGIGIDAQYGYAVLDKEPPATTYFPLENVLYFGRLKEKE